MGAANCITLCRLGCGIVLFFCPPLTVPFYIIYLIGGISDMIDGTVARITHTASALGARLDSAADIVFVLACMIKLLPVLEIPGWLLPCMAVIIAVRAVNAVLGYRLHGKPIFLHTAANKLTGALLFLLPLTLTFIDIRYSAAAVCIAALFASVQEGILIKKGRRAE